MTIRWNRAECTLRTILEWSYGCFSYIVVKKRQEMIRMVEERIRYLFLRYPDCLYGFTDISYSRYAEHYKSALVFAVPHGELLTMEAYTEERFEGGIREARAADCKAVRSVRRRF